MAMAMAMSKMEMFPLFMTHMLCCHIETAKVSAPTTITLVGPFAPCPKKTKKALSLVI